VRWFTCFVLIACGALSKGPKQNELVAKTGRNIAFRAPIANATFCSTCGRDAPVTIEFGAPARVRLVIPLCYAHAKSKIGDHDNPQIAFVDGTAPPFGGAAGVAATAGELDIEDCTSKHVIAKMWATFPDNRRIDTVIDTDLVEPAK
jgi:hypothetical protein